METRYGKGRNGARVGGAAAVRGAAVAVRGADSSDMAFPGCDPVPMTWDDVEAYDGRIEYWDAPSGKAWILRDAGIDHESPVGLLSEMLIRISQERGSRIRLYGAVYLMDRDAAGRPRQVMVAEQTIYLHARRLRLSGVAIERGRDPLPDVILEVDHTTDVRRNKLRLYEAWGFGEVWVETPDAPSRSRPARVRPGLTIRVLENGRFRESAQSRAFPGWSAAGIHAALNEKRLSGRTLADLTRVGRRLGQREGTTPDDDPQLGRHRRQARGAGREEGLRAGRAEGREAGRTAAVAESLAGQRALLVRLAARKFDAGTAARLADALGAVTDPDRLAAFADRIVDCAAANELLSGLPR